MTAEQKRLWWKRKNLVSFAWLLNDTRKVINDWKIYQFFWRITEYLRVPERESPKPKRLLFFQIHFTSDYSNMVAKFTKVNTSQSFKRNFLMKHRKCYASVDNQNANQKMN